MGSLRSLVTVVLASVLVGSAGFLATATDLTGPHAAPSGPGPYTGPSDKQLPDDEMRTWNDDVHDRCGKYALVFRNKDLREEVLPSGDLGVVRAQGTFFIQFQAVGLGSSEVVRFSFSFGATHDALFNQTLLNCNEEAPDNPFGKGVTGAYLYYYRSDFNAADGFFVPIRTNNVPDGEYTAAVHAYNGAGNEVARAWALAVVDNCKTDLASGISTLGCSQDGSQDVIAKDKTQPWPMILPGDGVQTNPVEGLTVEFPEPIIEDDVAVYVNGQQLQLESWTPPERDADLMPLNDDQDCPAGQDIRYICERINYGPGFKWIGAIEDGDVIRVHAKDLNFNQLERTVHVGAPTSGGTVELSEALISVEALNDDDVFIKPGDHHEFNARIQNIGTSDASLNFVVNMTTESGKPPDASGVQAYWSDVNGDRVDGQTIDAGQEVYLKVQIQTEDWTPTDHYYVAAIVEYEKDGVLEQEFFDAIVDVNPEASGNHQHLHSEGLPTLTISNETAAPLDNDTKGDGGALPSAGVGLAFLGAVAVVVLARRRED